LPRIEEFGLDLGETVSSSDKHEPKIRLVKVLASRLIWLK